MNLSDFDYQLPKELIAQKPASPRDHSRLLVLDRKTGKLEDRHFYDIVDYFKTGDVLVLNNTKVFPARLIGEKLQTGGRVEVFLLRQLFAAGKSVVWQCLLAGRGCKEGLKAEFKHDLSAEVIKDNQDGTWEVKFNQAAKTFKATVEEIGQMPLPPYIKRGKPQKRDVEKYQTVFAENKKTGSVAAPTAGLHFTPSLISKLKKQGVQFEYVTLHVGLGTFAAVKTEDILQHKMHAEWVETDKGTLKRIAKAKQEHRRIIAVGTTSVRTLETVWSRMKLSLSSGKLKDFNDWTDIFIYPGYEFKAVDAMITNFHVPKSTLLMLVSAFAQGDRKDQRDGLKKIRKAYRFAMRSEYRFLSYGDAMLIK